MTLTKWRPGGMAVLVRGCGGTTAGTQRNADTAAVHRFSRDTDAVIAQAQARVRASASDSQAVDTLAGAYLQKVREVGDPGYYPKVESLLTSALRANPQDGQAATLMGSLALARHQFDDPARSGLQASSELPSAASPLGVLVDAQTQLGHYQLAVATCQHM